MFEISAKDARNHWSQLLNQVEQGEEVLITRHGKKIAQISPTKPAPHLPVQADFRSSIKIRGNSLTATLLQQRKWESLQQ